MRCLKRLNDAQQAAGIVEETPLSIARLLGPEAAVAVEHRELGDADAGSLRGGDGAPRHLRQVVVGTPVRPMMEIVKLADRRVAGLAHLDVELRRYGLDLLRRQPGDEPVNPLPQGTEGVLPAAAGIGMPGEPRQGAR